MKILKVNKNNLEMTVKILRSNGIVVYPTETAYGLGADPFNSEAVRKIYQIKARSFNKPLPLIADNLKTVERFFVLNKKEKELAKKFWPGPLTLILKTQLARRKEFGRQKKIAVRVSSDKIARNLAKNFGGLIISTSANVSGAGEYYSASAVAKQFKNKKFQPDIILDAGVLKKVKPSTIVKVKNVKIKIIRQGEIWI